MSDPFFIVPTYLKTTDITTSFLIGGVCAMVGGPLGITLAVGTTVGQLIHMRRRYKKDVKYANEVNHIMCDVVTKYMKKNNK